LRGRIFALLCHSIAYTRALMWAQFTACSQFAQCCMAYDQR
jgi:hypothetical protein